ncbi:MAG: hypothetical protein AAF645_05795 [Myxococcota bacterium]
MQRLSSSFLLLLLSLSTGCFGDDFTIFADNSPVDDSYGSPRNSLRDAYALGAPVDFVPSPTGERSFEWTLEGNALQQLTSSPIRLETIAAAEGTGRLIARASGSNRVRHDFLVAAPDELAFRLAEGNARTDVNTNALVFAEGSDEPELIVDYYAGTTRLFGRAIVTTDDLATTVLTTDNNDRIVLSTDEPGAYTQTLSVGERTFDISHRIVNAIATIEFEGTYDPDNDSLELRATPLTAEGDAVLSPVDWSVDGGAVVRTGQVVVINGPLEGRQARATLLGMEGAVDLASFQ